MRRFQPNTLLPRIRGWPAIFAGWKDWALNREAIMAVIRNCCSSIFAGKAAQHPSVSLFHDPARIQFLVSAAAQMPEVFEIFTLENGPLDMAAAVVTLLDRGCRRFYTGWFAPEYEKHSPALALIYEITRQSLSAGLDCDYMTGEQPYKMRLATSSVPLYRVHATPEQLAALDRTQELEDGWVKLLNRWSGYSAPRKGRKNSRISCTNNSGSSRAAKRPPRGISLQRCTLKKRSAHSRGAGTISAGNMAKAAELWDDPTHSLTTYPCECRSWHTATREGMKSKLFPWPNR